VQEKYSKNKDTNPLTPTVAVWVGYSYKASCARPVICNFWHPGTATLRVDRQSTRMSKITNDGWLNHVWHRMLYCWTHMATVGVKGL